MESTTSIELHDLCIRNVKIAEQCKNQLQSIDDSIWGNVLNAIECPEWHISFNSYDFDDVRAELARVFKDFFSLQFDIEVERYSSDIISYSTIS